MSNRDKQRFDEATAKWQELRAKKCFSVGPDAGRIAVICSTLIDYDNAYVSFDEDEEVRKAENDKKAEEAAAEIENLRSEAQDFKSQASLAGVDAVVFDEATGDDFREVLTDPSFSSIIAIGHGSLSYLYMPNGMLDAPLRFSEFSAEKGPQNNRFDWWDVSREANHLKQGYFLQRQCGHAVRNLSVPMGVFAMADQRFVYAPVNTGFKPKFLLDRADLIESVAIKSRITYEEIKKYYPSPSEGEEPVMPDAPSVARATAPMPVASPGVTQRITQACLQTIANFGVRF